MTPGWRVVGFRGAAELGSAICAAIGLILVARSFGPATVGDLAFGTAIAQAGFIVLSLGTAASGGREVATSQALPSDTWWSVLVVRVPGAVIVAAAGAAICLLTGSQLLAWAVAVALLVSALRSEWLLVAVGAITQAALTRIGYSTAFLVMAAWISTAGRADLVPLLIVGPTAIYVVVGLSLCVGSGLIKRPSGSSAVGAQALSLIRSAPPILLGDISAFTYSGLDRVLLYWVGSPTAAGLYDAAFRLIQPLYLVSGVVTDAMFRPLAEKHDRPTMRRYADLMLVLTFPAGPFLLLFGVTLIQVLYGDAYSGSDAIARILGWVITVGYVAGLMVLPMLPWGANRVYGLSTGAGALTSLIGNLALIPTFGGVGAAGVGVLAKLASGIAAARPFARLSPSPLVELVAPYATASAAALFIGWVLTQIGVVVAIPGFLVAYVGVLAALGIKRPAITSSATGQIASDSKTRTTG